MAPMDPSDLQAMWDQRHRLKDDLGQPARVLDENMHLLPPAGSALDLACGRGRNSLILARAGLRVQAWDLSPVALQRLEQAAAAEGLVITSQVRDVLKQPPPAASFDVIVVAHFLDRALAPALVAALKPGGLLFYQTFIRAAVSDNGPTSAEFRLDDNELLKLFSPLRIRVYREEARLGDVNRGWRDLAMLVAQKAPV